MTNPAPKRTKSEPPPPITVEDTGSGAAPQPSPSPTRLSDHSRSFSASEARPQPHRAASANSLHNRRKDTWGHKRQGSPGVEWHTKWTKETWKQGRVLLIDYVAREHTEEGRRKIVAQEFSDIDSLRKFYRNDQLSQQAALRVIHVQNASWATRYLLRKFNIDASDDLVGTTFGRWAKYEKPKRRGQGDKAKPWLSGKTFRAQKDPWRGISRAAFGMDYLRHYEKRKIVETPANQGLKMMELNHFDALDNPAYGWDVYAQRLSVYVQMKEGEPGVHVDPNIRNPYHDDEEDQEYQRLKKHYGSVDANGQEQYIPKLQTLDNGSTIILFEHSQSGSVSDTLVGARQEIEQRWRRLTFYLPAEETSTDDRLAIECMDFILRDIFKALCFTWEKYINICETHVSILEDKIYENPADESRAPELWDNTNMWLKVERIMYVHTDIVREMRSHLKEVANENPQEDQNDPWLAGSAEEFGKLTTQFQEGVVKPTTNLSDLMYKSVGIRDARHSLQLGLSMWRLSWITFIFLPLTFVSGFFGMNVDTFEGNPSIKWWFIATVPLFGVVLVVWYGVKHALAKQHQSPLRRGVYETLFHEFADAHPTLWSRRGPREGIVPVGWWSAMKWQLINRWFSPDRTIATKDYDPGIEELGMMSRIKKRLAKRWLENIVVMPSGGAATSPLLDSLPLTNDPKRFGAIEELVQVSAPVAVAEADPTAASRLRQRLPLDRLRSLSPTRSEGGRPRSGGSGKSDGGESSVMIEEHAEDEGSADEHYVEEAKPKPVQQRLNVPL